MNKKRLPGWPISGKIDVDFDSTVGKIKAMHAVGQPPFGASYRSFDFSPINYLHDANIPYSRLHDVGGAFGANRFVDIPNIFRDFDADVNDPASYEFEFTDALIAGMYEHGVKPMFRLGVTIENQFNFRALRIHPPKDFHKWAQICEHVVRHYNEGWANGFHYGIEYWEIWNEPENGRYGENENQMWTGTPEQYFELYDVTAKHLKACFGDTIKVGGYASTSLRGIYYHPERYNLDLEPIEPNDRYPKFMFRLQFFFDFLKYIKENNSPIDYFTWHSYDDVEMTKNYAFFIDRTLKEFGFDHLEVHLNEWNNARERHMHGTSYASAAAAAMLCAMQNTPTDILCYYDTRLTSGLYCGFFDPIHAVPVCTYYSFVAFGELYKLGKQAACACDAPDVYALAATDGEKKAVLISNHSDTAKNLELGLDDSFDVYILDQYQFLVKTHKKASKLTLAANQVALIKNY